MALDLVPDLLEDRRRAERAEHARRHDALSADLDLLQCLAQVLAIVAEAAAVMAALAVVEEVLERVASDSPPVGATHPVGHDQEITGVLVEELVGLRVQGVGRRIPHDLIDPDRVAAVAVPDRTRNTVLLLTLDTSIGPEKGIDRRGCRLKPSSVLMTSMSAQSETRTAQSGFGKLTRTPVF
jgi:hypothetical protein